MEKIDPEWTFFGSTEQEIKEALEKGLAGHCCSCHRTVRKNALTSVLIDGKQHSFCPHHKETQKFTCFGKC